MDRKKLEEAQRRIEEQARTATLFRRFTIALVIVSLLAVTAAVVVWMARERATKQTRLAEEQAYIAEKQARLAEEQALIALSGRLAAQALLKMEARHDLTLLLSIEATRIADNVEGRSSLLSSLQKDPGLFKFFHGHEGRVYSVSFSPDGKLLASGSKDKTVRLWNMATGKAFGEPLIGHEGRVYSVSFSPDRKILASGSKDKTVRLWDMTLESWQARACSIANRNLMLEEWRQYMGDMPYCRTCPDLPSGKGVEVSAEKAKNKREGETAKK